MNFRKDDIVSMYNKRYRVIVCDEDLAVFAPVTLKKDGGCRTKMDRDLFVLSNLKSIQPPDHAIIGRIVNGVYESRLSTI